MGYGEKMMRTWGYVGGTFAIICGLVAVVLGVLNIVTIKKSVTAQTKDSFVAFSIFGLVLGAATLAVGALVVWKIFKADQIYLDIGKKASSIVVASRPKGPTQQLQPQTTEPNPANKDDDQDDDFFETS